MITGPTGIGKSYLSCAFVERACRRGFTATYVRMPRLLHQIAVARGDGSYARLLSRLARLDLLAIDDWLLAPLRDGERRTEAKQDVLYYENIEGGHGGAADNKQAAHMSALAYTFLWSRLR